MSRYRQSRAVSVPEPCRRCDACGLSTIRVDGALGPRDPPADRRRTDRHRSLRPRADAAVEPRRSGRCTVPRLPELALPVHRRQGRAGGAHGARRGRRRRAVHPAPGRVRARLDAGARDPAGRPGRKARGEELAWQARPPHPLDRRLHRPRLRRARDARALERREPPDHHLPGHEDRAALLRADGRARRDAIRVGGARIEVPGTARPDAEPLLAELLGRGMILITGASGFVGRHVTRALAGDSPAVRAMVRDARGAATLEGVRCELVRGDVTDPASLRAAARGVRTIVHLVAIVEGSPASFERVMAAGTGNLVEAARESGVRRIVLMSALGTGPGATVPYFRAKWAAEQAVAGSGLEHVALRPSFVFGTDGGVLPRFLRIARLAPVTPVIGPGTQRVQPIWIDDLVRAVRLAVPGEYTGGPVELGGPEAVTWNELWGRL